MNTTLKSLLLTALIGSALPVTAQTDPGQMPPDGPHRRHMSPEQHTERMSRDLDLSPEQISSVTEINNRFAEQMRALREPEEVRQARREAVRKLMEQHDQELRKVLDDTQYAKWEQERRDMKEKRAQRGRGMQAGEAAP